MMKHEYDPEIALNELLRKLKNESPYLAKRVEDAINAGMETQTEDEMQSIPKKNPLSEEEAISVALAVLKSDLIENRMIFQKVHEELTKKGKCRLKENTLKLKNQKDQLMLDNYMTPNLIDEEEGNYVKQVEIEVKTEIMRTGKNQQTFPLTPLNEKELKSLQEIFGKLEELTDFR